MLELSEKPLSPEEVAALNAYWRAANYLSVGQIYLLDNAMLTEPLQPEHVKPRLLGHWGTTPGLNLLYAHLNRVIRQRDLNLMYVIGPGHGGPAIAANTWLEGSYSETYPAVSRDAEGMERLFRQFSFPGGIPSHVAPELPGSIHEGGELGYSLSHAYGAVLDNPDLLVACVIGDGEAETGPLAASWHSNKFLDPRTDGAVLPILHLNGYKIANPAVLARIGDDELTKLLEGYGYRPYLVAGDEPEPVHQQLAATLDRVLAEIVEIQQEVRAGSPATRRPWPMIVLRTPKGWTGPHEVDGVQVEGTWRAHQVPLAGVRTSAHHLELLEQWLRSYRPDELFDEAGRPRQQLLAQVPDGPRRMGSNPHSNGDAIYEVSGKAWNADVLPVDEHLQLGGRVMEILSEHTCQGWLEGYLLTGRHGWFSCYEAFVHLVDSMVNQHAKWLKVTRALRWRQPIPSLNYLLTSHVWRQDHNGFSHQDPGFIDHVVNKKADVIRVYLPPDTNTLLSVADHCLRSRHYINVVVAGKQPQPNWLDVEAAALHCARGLGIWDWASNDDGDPDVVLACAGDVPTMEALAAVELLRQYLPDLKVRFVNVVDLMRLQPASEHPHGLPDPEYDAIFTTDRPVIFAYHGYPWLIHRLTYRRAGHDQLHVRGYKEEGTTTTPFDMLVMNDMDRYHLVMDVIDRVPGLARRAATVRQEMVDRRVRHREYVRRTGEDLPEVRDWRWPSP